MAGLPIRARRTENDYAIRGRDGGEPNTDALFPERARLPWSGQATSTHFRRHGCMTIRNIWRRAGLSSLLVPPRDLPQ